MARSIDVTGVLKLSDEIGHLTGVATIDAGVAALNRTIDETFDTARARMIAGINLSDPYLRRKMTVEHATAALPQARITAVGTTTPLSQFGAGQLTKDVTWSNQRITQMGKKFGKWPGWTRRTGVPGIGIPVDRKAAGRSAMVKPGTQSLFQHAFAIPGKTDNDGNLLFFSRSPLTGKLRTLLGPAVYQLFGYQIKLLEPDITDDLAANLYAQIDAAIAATFK